MSTLRALDTSGFAAIAVPAEFGAPPRLEWLPIASLVVDTAYQRDITKVGRKNVRHIAANFKWSEFSPVVVSPIEGERYAIVDGQHHCLAAKLCGITHVPCAIIEMAASAQARAFRAINGNVTRIHNLTLFHAAVAAGDDDAVRIAALCERAGVSVVRNPTAAQDMKPGQTMAAATIGRAAERFGDAITELALRTIVTSGDGNAGMLSLRIIWGVTEVLADHPEWCVHEAKLRTAFDGIDLSEMLQEAASTAARVRGSSAIDQFEGLLVDALMKALGRGSKTK